MPPTLLDTDILSFFFRNNSQVVEKVSNYLNHYPSLSISLITYYEVLNGLYYKDAQKQLKNFEAFVSINQVLPLTEDIAKIAAIIYADLRKQNQMIGHNDCLIAATAINHNLILITNNTAHFSRIQNLRLDNWAI